MTNMENQSLKYSLRFTTHLLAQAIGWAAIIFVREMSTTLPFLVDINSREHVSLVLFLAPFWALGIWITQLHRHNVPIPLILITFVMTTLLSLFSFFAFQDTSALSRTIFTTEIFLSPLIAIFVARIWPFPTFSDFKIELGELEIQMKKQMEPHSAFHVGIQGWERNDFYRVIHESHMKKLPVFLDIPVMERPRLPKYRNFFKASIDILGATVGLLMLSPIMLITSALIYLTDRGPVFFVQYRVGIDGKMFPLYKFRSMVINADELKDNLMDKNELEGPAFKMKRDPRITRIGAIIRKTSIDELPQLFNVLRGHMSLVGPRPHLAEEVQHYSPEQYRRLLVTPGLTCIWQVYGRNKVDFNTWIKQDLQYIDEWSVMLDIRLILLTVPAMIRGEGL